VLLDAMTRAGGTDPAKVRDALAEARAVQARVRQAIVDRARHRLAGEQSFHFSLGQRRIPPLWLGIPSTDSQTRGTLN